MKCPPPKEMESNSVTGPRTRRAKLLLEPTATAVGQSSPDVIVAPKTPKRDRRARSVVSAKGVPRAESPDNKTTSKTPKRRATSAATKTPKKAESVAVGEDLELETNKHGQLENDTCPISITPSLKTPNRKRTMAAKTPKSTIRTKDVVPADTPSSETPKRSRTNAKKEQEAEPEGGAGGDEQSNEPIPSEKETKIASLKTPNRRRTMAAKTPKPTVRTKDVVPADTPSSETPKRSRTNAKKEQEAEPEGGAGNDEQSMENEPMPSEKETTIAKTPNRRRTIAAKTPKRTKETVPAATNSSETPKQLRSVATEDKGADPDGIKLESPEIVKTPTKSAGGGDKPKMESEPVPSEMETSSAKTLNRRRTMAATTPKPIVRSKDVVPAAAVSSETPKHPCTDTPQSKEAKPQNINLQSPDILKTPDKCVALAAGGDVQKMDSEPASLEQKITSEKTPNRRLTVAVRTTKLTETLGLVLSDSNKNAEPQTSDPETNPGAHDSGSSDSPATMTDIIVAEKNVQTAATASESDITATMTDIIVAEKNVQTAATPVFASESDSTATMTDIIVPEKNVQSPAKPLLEPESNWILYSPDGPTVKPALPSEDILYSPEDTRQIPSNVLFSPDSSVTFDTSIELVEPETPLNIDAREVIVIPDTPYAHQTAISTDAPLDATFSPVLKQITPPTEPATAADQPLDTTFSPVKPSAPVILIRECKTPHSTLRGIRKRSISLDCSVVKMNRSVFFHSPANEEMAIPEIDRIMEISRIEQSVPIREKGMTPAARRQRVLSNLETSTLKPLPVRGVLTPRKMPNFKEIHQRNFDKMESISDYKHRREATGATVFNPLSKAKLKSKIPTASNTLSPSLAKIEAIKSAVREGNLVKPVARLRENSCPKEIPSTSKASSVMVFSAKPLANNAASATRKPSSIPSFAFGTTTVKTDIHKLDSLSKRRAQYKSHASNSTAQVGENNKKLLNGVRSNRRFELLMKYRKESTE